jgi:uncharacterized OsmC-like protein
MENNQLEVAVNLSNQKVQFTGLSKSNPDLPVVFDVPPPLGDGQGFMGLEALLLSFAGCVSTTIVCLLRKAGKNVSGFTMNARGIKRLQPLSLQTIYLEVIVESRDTNNSDLQSAVGQAEEKSPVWAAIKNNVEVHTECRVVNKPENAE